MTIVFEGCRVFDGVSAEPREDATVVVEDGRIKEVADGALRAFPRMPSAWPAAGGP